MKVNSMNSTPLISVIVPVYNIQDYLEECVCSIQNQTYPNLEIILVDDGSTDNSGAICDSLCKSDHRITVIHKKNGGLSSARNAGLDVMHGEYVSFIDGDDIIALKLYETILEKFSQYDYDFVAFGYSYFKDNDSLKRGKTCSFSKDLVCDRREAYRLCLFKSVSACTKVYRGDLFRNIRFKEGVVSEDAYILPDIIRLTHKCLFAGYAGYFYRQRDNSITHAPYKEGESGIVLSHYRLYCLAKKGDHSMVKAAEYRMGLDYNMFAMKWRNNTIWDLYRYRMDLRRIVFCYCQVVDGIKCNSLIDSKIKTGVSMLCRNLPIWFVANKYFEGNR